MRLLAIALFAAAVLGGCAYVEYLAWRECLADHTLLYCMRTM